MEEVRRENQFPCAPSELSLIQEFCRIYRQYFPFGSSDILASLIFKAFPPEKDGTVGFKQFVVNLSIVLRGSTDETLKCEILVNKVTHSLFACLQGFSI